MNIIHLSDLHFGTSHQANLWSSQLLQDLRFELNISTIDALIISGDIASNSTETEYDAALEFINEFRTDFNLEHSQIVVVPGNHDLNWDLSKKAYKLINMNDYEGPFILTNGEKRPDPSHAIERGNDLIEQKDEDLSRDRFRYFSQFFQKIKHKSYPISDYARNYTIDFLPGNADQPLLVLGLNSAWEIDHHYKDRASINMDALSNALKEINRSPDYSRCHKFAVWHHPLDSASNDRIKDRSFLDQLVVSGFSIFMHGHVHKAEMSPYHYDMRTNGRRIHRICAGTFGASTRDLVPGYPWQYNVLQIIRDQVTVTTRRREEENGVWKPDARWSQGAGEDPSPRYTVPLVQTEAVKGETKIRASRRGLAIVDDLSIQRQWDKGQTKYDFFLSNGIRYADCEKFWTRQRIDFKVFKDICTLARVD
jgi:3',5'-cyclic AMP phosphodiesterase CpdA